MKNSNELEAEANYFARCLLMPADMVKEEVEKIEWNLSDDKAIKELAKRFDVPITAMVVRLSELKIFNQYSRK